MGLPKWQTQSASTTKQKQRCEELVISDERNQLKHQTVLVLMYAAGLRVGEVVRLQMEDIFLILACICSICGFLSKEE